MEIRTISKENINPAPYNPRKDLQPGDEEWEKIKQSIDEFGCVEPLIWNERTKNLVGGHQRYKILLASGQEKFDVSVVNLDDVKEKQLNIALNKLQGNWDDDLLCSLLQELRDVDAVELTGFDAEEVSHMLDDVDISIFDDFFEPEKPKKDTETNIEDKQSSEENMAICPNCGHCFRYITE